MLWKRVNEVDADNTLVKSGKVMIMSKIPENPAQAKKVVWSQVSLCPLCCQLRNAFWADESQHMTKMGLCSTVCVCVCLYVRVANTTNYVYISTCSYAFVTVSTKYYITKKQ